VHCSMRELLQDDSRNILEEFTAELLLCVLHLLDARERVDPVLRLLVLRHIVPAVHADRANPTAGAIVDEEIGGEGPAQRRLEPRLDGGRPLRFGAQRF